MIHFRTLCLVVYPTYFVSSKRTVVRTGILFYDPRGQNDPRNRSLDDQLDRMRGDRDISECLNVSQGFSSSIFRLVNQCPLDIFLIKSILNSDLF